MIDYFGGQMGNCHLVPQVLLLCHLKTSQDGFAL